jgi:hypothetical protein
MYVEVSGRQTGKSTRMVEDIVLFLEENGGKTALVVSPTGASRKLIKEKIFQKCGYCINRVITSHKMLPPMNTMKQYVDEFFYVKEKDLFIDGSAYYTGTPKLEVFAGKYQDIIDLFNQKMGKMVQLKPIKKHGFGGND